MKQPSLPAAPAVTRRTRACQDCGASLTHSRAMRCAACRQKQQAAALVARRKPCPECGRQAFPLLRGRCLSCRKKGRELPPQPAYGVLQVDAETWAVRHPDPDRSAGGFGSYERACAAARARGLEVPE